MSFLAMKWNTVVDQHFVAAVPEVPAVLDFDGNEVTPAVPAVPEVEAVSHEEVEKVWIEDDAGQVARNLAAGMDIDYFELDINGNRQTVNAHKVRLKAGPRTPAPAREMAVVEANGADVGSVEVDA